MKTATKRKTKSPATLKKNIARRLANTPGWRYLSESREADLVVQDDAEKELLMWISPLYSMKPSLRNLFMKKLTRERVVPIISASILGKPWKHLLRLVLRAIAREQQQSARQPFLAGVEELIDQVLFDADGFYSAYKR